MAFDYCMNFEIWGLSCADMFRQSLCWKLKAWRIFRDHHMVQGGKVYRTQLFSESPGIVYDDRENESATKNK